MADASALGIHPPNTVRIDLDGWTQDWPFEQVDVLGDQVVIRGLDGRPLIYYPYEHAVDVTPKYHHTPAAFPARWAFHGRQSFTVEAGPPQAPSLN